MLIRKASKSQAQKQAHDEKKITFSTIIIQFCFKKRNESLFQNIFGKSAP